MSSERARTVSRLMPRKAGAPTLSVLMWITSMSPDELRMNDATRLESQIF